MNSMKIVLIGKTGTGKSATANTILGRKKFESKPSSTSITHNCQKAESDVDGRRVTVVDTPGLFDNSLSNEEVIDELTKCITLLAPGPHVFLLVVSIGRFTPEEKDTVEYIKKAFGKDAEKYTMILFTHGDDLEEDGRSIQDHIQNGDDSLKKLISDCGNRFHVFNNREKKDRTQVKELLEKINHMVKENGGIYDTNEMPQEQEQKVVIQKQMEGILKGKDEEIRRMREERKRYKQQYAQQVKNIKTYVQELQQQNAQHVENMETYVQKLQQQYAQQVENMEKFILQLQQQQDKQVESTMNRFDE